MTAGVLSIFATFYADATLPILKPVPYVFLGFVAVAWPLSHRFLMRHHVQHVATLELVHSWIGISVGTYWTADPGWSKAPATWASNRRNPLVRFSEDTDFDGQLVQLCLPYTYILVLATASLLSDVFQRTFRPR